jgi:hypothetical protein
LQYLKYLEAQKQGANSGKDVNNFRDVERSKVIFNLKARQVIAKNGKSKY